MIIMFIKIIINEENNNNIMYYFFVYDFNANEYYRIL
jgi:hypothetical protein